MSKSFICYTDGSCRPLPGISGYGVHGYLTDNEADKKPKQILGKWIPTNIGYKIKTEQLLKEMKDNSFIKNRVITDIVDIYGNNRDSDTNNKAEMDAVIELFKLFLLDSVNEIFCDVSSIFLLIDSTYVLGHLKKIKENPNHTSEVNTKHVETLRDYYYKIVKGDVEIGFDKVAAHSNHLGNDRADLLANLGRLSMKPDEDTKKFIFIPESHYWGKFVNRNPMFNNSLLFDYGKKTVIKGYRYYHLLKYKEVGDIGKRNNSSAYIQYATKKTETIIEKIETIIKERFGNYKVPYVILLDAVYNKLVHKLLSLYHKDYLTIVEKPSVTVITADKIAVAKEIYPVGVSHHARDIITKLTMKLDDFIHNNLAPNITAIDITEDLFTKDSKERTILKPDIVNDKFKYTINLHAHIGVKHKLRLYFGLDTPTRNTLKKLEKNVISLFILIENNKTNLKYDTVLVVNEGVDELGYVLTSNYHANTIFPRGERKKS